MLDSAEMTTARASGGRAALLLALACALAPACNVFERPPVRPGEDIDILPEDFRPEVLQVRLQEYLIAFGTSVASGSKIT